MIFWGLFIIQGKKTPPFIEYLLCANYYTTFWGPSHEQASALLTKNLRSSSCCYSILQTKTLRLRDMKTLGQTGDTCLALKLVPGSHVGFSVSG